MPGYPIPQSGGEPQGGSPFPMASGPKAGGEIMISRAEAMALRAFETDEDEARATKRAQAESGLSTDQLKVLRSRADKARGGGYALKGPGITFKPKPGQEGDEPGLLGRSDLDRKSEKRVKDEAKGFVRQDDKDQKLSTAYGKTAPAKTGSTRESNLRECGDDGTCSACARRVREARRRLRYARR